MKLAFVSGNREQLPDPVVPLGLLYVIAACPDRHDKVLWDLCFEPDPEAALGAKVAACAPDLVAIGMRNLQDNHYGGCAESIGYYRALVQVVRRHTGAPVVVGGGGFSVMPRALMEELGCDYGIEGEGEVPFAQLVEQLEGGAGSLSDIAGLYYRVDGELVHNPRRGFVSLDTLAVPDRGAVDPRHYQLTGIDSVQTKRGCGVGCAYCTYPRIEGSAVRTRAPALVVEEMRALARPPIEHVFIVDSVFNLPREHALGLCRELSRCSFALPWTCYANPIGLDHEIGESMARAGCVGVEVGVDSGSDAVLARLRKGFDTARVRAMQRALRAAGIKDCLTFMLGTPGETLADVARTLDFASELSPVAAILMIWTDEQESLDPRLARERRELREAIRRLLGARARHEPRWVVPQLGVRFRLGLFRALRKLGIRGPLWQQIDGAAVAAAPASGAGEVG